MCSSLSGYWGKKRYSSNKFLSIQLNTSRSRLMLESLNLCSISKTCKEMPNCYQQIHPAAGLQTLFQKTSVWSQTLHHSNELPLQTFVFSPLCNCLHITLFCNCPFHCFKTRKMKINIVSSTIYNHTNILE